MPVYKTKKGYFVQINFKDQDGNYRQKKKTGFSTQREAKAWEREFLSNELNFTSTAKFSKAAEMYMEDLKARVKASTYRSACSYIRNDIMPYWKDYQLDEITVEAVEKWQQSLISSDYKSSSLIQHQVMFKAILNFAIKKNMYSDLKVINLPNKSKNEQKTEMLFWELDEFNKFISVIDDITHKALFYILYTCGLRIGETLALQWKDIDFDNKSLRVSKTYDFSSHISTSPKTEKSNRLVIIPKKCMVAINTLYERDSKCVGFNDDCFIFGFRYPISLSTVHYNKNRYCKLAGVKQIRIHDFRHSHVSLLINLRFSPFDIAKRLGHSVDMVNNRYGHWFKDAQRKMVDKLDSTL